MFIVQYLEEAVAIGADPEAGRTLVMSLPRVRFVTAGYCIFDSSKICLGPHSGFFSKTALFRAVLGQNCPFLGQNWFLSSFFLFEKIAPGPKTSPKTALSCHQSCRLQISFIPDPEAANPIVAGANPRQ